MQCLYYVSHCLLHSVSMSHGSRCSACVACTPDNSKCRHSTQQTLLFHFQWVAVNAVLVLCVSLFAPLSFMSHGSRCSACVACLYATILSVDTPLNSNNKHCWFYFQWGKWLSWPLALIYWLIDFLFNLMVIGIAVLPYWSNIHIQITHKIQ